jgi:hypothetical protein
LDDLFPALKGRAKFITTLRVILLDTRSALLMQSSADYTHGEPSLTALEERQAAVSNTLLGLTDV